MNKCTITIQYDGELKEVSAGHHELRAEGLPCQFGDGIGKDLMRRYLKQRDMRGREVPRNEAVVMMGRWL